MKTITLFLGSKCNANCTYCHADKTTEGSADPSVAFYRYLNAQMKDDHGLTIWFLGGEPTLYMPAIKAIVNFCAGRNVSYRVTTNGLRLCDDEVVDFFNEHNFYVTVSFDGVRGIRGYDDIFYRPEYYRNLRRLKNIGCSITLSHENADMYKIATEIGRIENRLGRFLPLRPHYVHATTPIVAQMGFSNLQAQQYVDNYISLMNKFIRDYKCGLFNIKLYPLFMLLFKGQRKLYQFPETRCFNKSYVQIDLQGNFYSCAYERTKENFLGRVEDEAGAANRLAEVLAERRPKCLDCEFYRYCGTHCLISLNRGMECYIHQRLLRWFIDTIDQQKIDYKKLAEEEFAKRTGGFYDLYR